MIDRTSTRIEQQETALRRHNRRRYAFQRMLEATDRVLWRLEEMNRDGVKTVSGAVRAELREAVETMPRHIREPLRDGGIVQDTLDSLFEIQERLFRWRFPDWDDTEPDDFDYGASASPPGEAGRRAQLASDVEQLVDHVQQCPRRDRQKRHVEVVRACQVADPGADES